VPLECSKKQNKHSKNSVAEYDAGFPLFLSLSLSLKSLIPALVIDVYLVIAAFCMGSSRVSSQEVGWERSLLYSRIQSTWERQRIWLCFPG